jgi:hypothetical protein
MAITHYIDTSLSEIARSRVKSLTNRVPEAFPVLVIGDTRAHNWIFNNQGTVESFSGNAAYTLRVTIGDVNLGPDAGSYTLTCGETTDALSVASDAAAIELALNALATVTTAGGVKVSGTYPNFLVSWVDVGAQTALTASGISLIPSGEIGVTTLQTGDLTHCQQTAIQIRQNPITTQTTWTAISSPAVGWTGTLTTNTAEAINLLIQQGETVGDFTQYTTVLQAEVIDGDGNVASYYQTPITIRASNLEVTALNPTPFPSVYYVQNRPGITGLVSAVVDSVKLGGLPTSGGQMPTGSVVLLNFAVTVTDADGTHTGYLSMFYRLTSGVQAQSHPIWIQPYDYNASTNAVVWKLIGTYLDLIPAAYNTTTEKFHYMGVAGAAGACYAYPDQTGSSAPA